MVKFISYSGNYPCLCMGQLIVEIDGKEVSFGGFGSKCDYPRFWTSGGSCSFDSSWNPNVESGEWRIRHGALDDINNEEIKKLIPEILKVMNENTEHGCCGGCL